MSIICAFIVICLAIALGFAVFAIGYIIYDVIKSDDEYNSGKVGGKRWTSRKHSR